MDEFLKPMQSLGLRFWLALVVIETLVMAEMCVAVAVGAARM